MSILWRPSLFSTAGASFLADATVRDGVHLRWMMDPRLGLPFEYQTRQWGGFHVYEQIGKFPALDKTDLASVKSAGQIPVHSQTDTNADYLLEQPSGNTIYFLHKIKQPASIAAGKLLNQLRSLNQNLITEVDQPYLEYIGDIATALRGKVPFLHPAYQRGEVCAVDLFFKPGTGVVPGHIITDPRRPETLAFIQQKYARVRAYDQQGHLLQEDWIGRTASMRLPLRTLIYRNKFSVRFRAPGIYRITIEGIAGQPIMNRVDTQWIFCEEYCNAPVWNQITPDVVRFKGDSEHYSESVLKDHYYEPFQKTFDWSQLLATWKNEVMHTSEMKTFLLSTDTYQMFSEGVDMESVGTDGNVTVIRGMSMLLAMLQSAVDPAVASLLGLYTHFAEQTVERDIRVVAELPFFDAGNLEKLYEELKKVVVINGVPFTVPERLGLADPPRRYKVQLGGLVLSPAKGAKESPPAPTAFTTLLTAMDLPTEDMSTVLMVQAKMMIAKPPFSMLPYKRAVAYEVERSIDSQPFSSTVTDETALDEIGILPGVYFPREQDGETHLAIRDSFTLPLPTDAETVQYRARSFDTFARPSLWIDGVLTNIPFPCHPPLPPALMSATIHVHENLLWLEMMVTVTNETKVLQALAEKLEFALHTLTGEEAGGVQDIRWAGTEPARGLTLTYDNGTRYPDLSTAALSCLSLEWTGTPPDEKLNWNPAPSSTCDGAYPPATPIVALVTNPVLDSGITNFKTYRIRIALADQSLLPEGNHFWACRARVKGMCDEGDIKYSQESCSSVRYRKVMPPPPVVQPVGWIIPESTFPDKRGDAYYNVPLNQFLAPIPTGQTALVNIYRINLQNLQADLTTLVDGKNLLPGMQTVIQDLAHASKYPFQKMNDLPVIVRSAPGYFPLKVEGNLEDYFVLGIVGTNSEGQESSWDRAAITVFKTPAPVPKPTIRFTGIKSYLEDDTLLTDVTFMSDIAVDASSPIVVPLIQVKRFDLNTGSMRFLGEAPGSVNGGYYQFVFRDTQAISWRSYSYEATLLTASEGKRVISEQRAKGNTLVPGLPAAKPLDAAFLFTATTTAAGNVLEVEFLIGNFEISIIKLSGDVRDAFAGEIRDGKILGLTNAVLSMNAAKTNYKLVWTDAAGGSAEYTFRIGRGQHLRWSKKIQTA